VVQRGLSDGVLGKKLQVDMSVYRAKVNELATSAYADRSRAALVHYAKEKGAVRSLRPHLHLRPGGNRRSSHRDRPGEGRVRGKAGRRHRLRLVPQAGRSGGVAACRRHPVLKEGLAEDEGGREGRIVCPASIAYGDAGKPPSVPPKSTLIFDVELLAVEAPGK